MYRSNGIGIIVWIYLIIKATFGQLKPSNAVVEIGGEAIFNCSGTVTPHWFFSKNGTPTNQLVIAESCDVKVNYLENHYETEKIVGQTTRPTACNLIVFNATMEQAGAYWCSDSTLSYALLTVLEKSPTATYNTTENVVAENENVIITCSLNHSGSVEPAPTLRPYFYWKDSYGDKVNSSYDWTTEKTTVSQLTVTAGRQNIVSYTCFVYLQLTPSTIKLFPGYANNTPTINMNVHSPTIDVLFSPSTPSVTSRTKVIRKDGVECEVSVVTCNSTGNPPPRYRWFDMKQSLHDAMSENQTLQHAEINRNYTCEAYNWMRSARHSNSTTYKVTATENSTNISYCILDNNSPSRPTDDLLTTIITAAVLGGYGLCNIVATILFLVYYNRKCDDKEMSTFKNKSKLNARFPWLQRMLPCMNESRGNAGCSFLWVILFILMSILVGIIVFPIVVAMVNCSRKRKNSKETSDTAMSNEKRSKTAGNPSTAAHGDFEDPYDEINTIRHDRKHTLEEPTSAKNTKDAKKVFYTRVNPNLGTGEDIERYSVTMPS